MQILSLPHFTYTHNIPKTNIISTKNLIKTLTSSPHNISLLRRNLINLILLTSFVSMYSVIDYHHSFRSFRAQSLNLMECSGTYFRVESESLQLRFSARVSCKILSGSPKNCEAILWGEEEVRRPKLARRVLCRKPLTTRWQYITECFEEHSD